jgi:hypothetical protein
MLNLKSVLAVGLIGVTLSGCYVMPLNQAMPGQGGYTGSGTAIIPVAAIRAPFTARLYPGNQAASRMGPTSGIISNPEDGHGQFSFNVGGESFSGEATRAPNTSRGLANATGNRGGFARCDYTMSGANLGSGSCLFNNGARYDMHISQ